LCAIIECELGHDPFSSYFYAFTNKRRNKIKCLFWVDIGFVLYKKSLLEEKFKWPKRDDKIMVLMGQQIYWLLDGYDIIIIKGHKKLHYETVS
jgi:transposase